MFLSRIWFVLVALFGGVTLTAAFVAPRPADRLIEQLEGQRLDRAQYAAEQVLRSEAHRWIDTAAKLGRDAPLADALDTASRGEPRSGSEAAKTRLRAMVPNPSAIGVETLTAVDVKGRVVARLGERENEVGESIAGVEVVADALRGYLSDDVWASGGRIRRMAVAPVLSRTRDRIVGAVLVGVEAGRRLADLWKNNLRVDVAIVLGRQVQSATMPEALLGGLPALIEERSAQIAEVRRTRPIPIDVGSDRLLAVAAPFAGMAAEQKAYYVLVGKKTPASSPWALLSNTSRDDLSWGRFPWLGLLGTLVAMVAVGLWLQRVEVSAPLARLRVDVQRLGRGEIPRIDDRGYPGRIGGVARDVNAAVEKFTHAAAASSRSETSRKDISAILESEEADAKTINLRGPAVGLHQSPSALPPAPGFLGLAPPPALAASAVGATPQARLVSPTFGAAPSGRGALPPSAPAGAVPPPPPRAPAMPPMPPIPASPPPPPTASAPLDDVPSRSVVSPGSAAPIATSPAIERAPAVPTATPSAPSEESPEARPGGGPVGSVSAVAASGDDEVRTTELPSERAASVLGDPEDDHVQVVFAEYVDTRRRCGEGVDTLTLEKFRGTLGATRQQIVAKYGCRTARFSVYVKDGKAAIKASPVKE